MRVIRSLGPSQRATWGLLWLLVVSLVSTHVTCQAAPPPFAGGLGGFLEQLRSMISPMGPAEVIVMPDCLVTLTGGIETIEETLQRDLQKGATWTVLITSRNDRTSIPAVERYYEAVRLMCGEESRPAQQQEEPTLRSGVIGSSTGSDGSEGTDEGFDAVAGEGRAGGATHLHEDDASASPIVVDLDTVKDYRFAHVSFDDESGMIWRWWIWKVPIVVFVSPSSAPAERLYDTRFWKIAWTMPSTRKIVEVVSEKLWLQIDVWSSVLSPGAQLHQSTKYMAAASEKVYKFLDPIPNWLLAVGGSFLGSLMLSYLHRGDQKTAAAAAAPAARKTQ